MNQLTLAVAGGRKTQSIVDACVAAPKGRRILVLTYTQMNQQELTKRLAMHRPLNASVEVQGWFSFLLGNWVRPYLPKLFTGRRLHGLNFDGDPGRYAKGERRFLDADGKAYKLHLAKLALDTNAVSSSAALDRLSRIYHEIYIDEVQDLNGYDLEVLAKIMRSQIELHLVGDVRQALLQTNIRDQKHSEYRGINIKNWFEIQKSSGLLDIHHEYTTWRSNQLIANFADSIFDTSWGFPGTISMNTASTGHDGVFAVANEHVDAYVARFNPLCLRHNVMSARDFNLPFMNIGIAKGMSVDRVLIGPTTGVLDFLRKGKRLGDQQSCSLYVAITRARASVAIANNKPDSLGVAVWTP